MLIEQNKTTRYLTYAFGEILLVVIGILIALRVNNWNENLKQSDIESKYFVNLKNDLNADIEGLDLMIELANTKVTAARFVKRNSNQNSVNSLYEFSQVMMDLLFVDEFRPNDNTYEEMKNNGHLSTLRNDELKLKLMNLKKTYQEIASARDHIRNDFDVFLEDFEQYIDWGKYYDLEKSNIPQLEFTYDSAYIESHAIIMKQEVLELYKNKVFLNNIFLLEINYAYMSEIFKSTKSQIQEIIETIDQELDQ